MQQCSTVDIATQVARFVPDFHVLVLASDSAPPLDLGGAGVIIPPVLFGRLVPRADVIDSYVVEDADGAITDFASFYTLPSSILGHPQHSVLKAAYMYYTVPGATQLQQLMTDVMIEARRKGYDVFNALDVLQNQQFLKELKFGEGDGFLRYYLFNWRVVEKLQPSDVGLVLL